MAMAATGEDAKLEAFFHEQLDAMFQLRPTLATDLGTTVSTTAWTTSLRGPCPLVGANAPALAALPQRVDSCEAQPRWPD